MTKIFEGTDNIDMKFRVKLWEISVQFCNLFCNNLGYYGNANEKIMFNDNVGKLKNTI